VVSTYVSACAPFIFVISGVSGLISQSFWVSVLAFFLFHFCPNRTEYCGYLSISSGRLSLHFELFPFFIFLRKPALRVMRLFLLHTRVLFCGPRQYSFSTFLTSMVPRFLRFLLEEATAWQCHPPGFFVILNYFLGFFSLRFFFPPPLSPFMTHGCRPFAKWPCAHPERSFSPSAPPFPCGLESFAIVCLIFPFPVLSFPPLTFHDAIRCIFNIFVFPFLVLLSDLFEERVGLLPAFVCPPPNRFTSVSVCSPVFLLVFDPQALRSY